MNTDNREGNVAKAIESQTSKLPSDVFLWTGLGLLGTSVALHALKQSHTAALIGQMAAPVLIMGLYNKTVKQMGHDSKDPTISKPKGSSAMSTSSMGANPTH